MSGTRELVMVYSTFPDLAAAEAAGRVLIERRLAACVNIIPGMVSLYRWQGAVARDQEVVMLAKTQRSLADAAMRAIAEAHPYEVPALLVLPLAAAEAAYGAWIEAETSAAPTA